MARIVLLLVIVSGVGACSGSSDDGTRSASPSGPADQPAELDVLETVTLYAPDAGDRASALATGDFNGDGSVDVLLAAAFADGPENSREGAGEAYVFLGPFEAGETRDAGHGQQGFTLFGADAGDQTGRSAGAGDFNGDGLDDIVIGAPFGDGPANDRPDAGEVRIVLGSADLGAQLKQVDLREGAYFSLYGASPQDFAGFDVTTADLNGDASADIVVGAFWAEGADGGKPMAGQVYGVFGGQPGIIDVSQAAPDLLVYGAASGDRLGEGVAAGDVNGDGLDDLVLPAPFASGRNGQGAAGRTYLIHSPLPRRTDLAVDSVGAVVYGIDDGDQLGHVTVTGDVDGDGLADVLLTAVSADGRGNAADLSGEVLLIAGASLTGEIDASSDSAGIVLYGADAEDRLGRSAALGDVNGDGLADLLLGAPGGDGDGDTISSAGEIYVLSDVQGLRAEQLPDGGRVRYGGAPNDELATEVFGRRPLTAADMNGDGLHEILVATPGSDGPDGTRGDCGSAQILFVGP